MLERKVYEGYAFKPGENEKRDINWEIYNELIQKYKVFCGDTRRCKNTDAYDIVINRTPGYLHSVYKVIQNRPELATPELALLCDHGNLCFGYTTELGSGIYVFED